MDGDECVRVSEKGRQAQSEKDKGDRGEEEKRNL